MKRTWLASVTILGVCGLALLLAACDVGAAATVTATETPWGTPLGGGTVTPTITTALCSTIDPGFNTASGGTLFGDVPFPQLSASTKVTLTHVGNSYTFAIYGEDVCTAGSSADAVRAYYAAQLPVKGFTHSNTFPFDGLFEAGCGDPYCWASANARYVGLEAVKDRGNGLVTYHLRFAYPPAAPSCPGSGWSSGYYAKLPAIATYTDVELPPLTRIRAATGPGPSAKAAYDLCSPFYAHGGDLIAFMAAHGGWGPVSPGLNFVGPQGTITVEGFSGSSSYISFYLE